MGDLIDMQNNGSLPLHVPDAGNRPGVGTIDPAAGPAAPVAPRTGGRERILLVGEDAAQRMMIGRRLQADGYEVASCESGRETVLALLRGSADLLLVNAPLRDCSAAALLRWTRSRRGSTHMTCMVMVAANDTQLVAGLYDAGADFVITRRTELDLLPRKVAAALARRPLALAS
jgi:DNA-binding response OmpR family regulator